MGEQRVVTEWRSLHQDYLQFAFDSVLAAQASTSPTAVQSPLDRVAVNRSALEAVRYSYDALEASVEFVFHRIRTGQTHLAPDDTWLKRFLRRKFRGSGLADRLGLISWAWSGQEFWRSEEQRALFDDLKKLRDGFTHLRPVGREVRKEVLEKVEEGDTVLTVSRLLEEKLIGAETFVTKNGIASFTDDPTRLSVEDAEKAFEIALLHVARFEEVTLGPNTGWFAVYDEGAASIRSPRELLRRIPRHFADIWPSPE